MRIDDLRRCLVVVFERLELPPEDAEGLAGLLVDSELRGHPDHGVVALGVLTTFYRERKLNPARASTCSARRMARCSSTETAVVDPARRLAR